MTTARLIATRKCHQQCSYCVNTQYKNVYNINCFDELATFDEIVVTGGEPMLWPGRLARLLNCVEASNKLANLYIYASVWTTHTPYSDYILDSVDGVTFTLHDESGLLELSKLQRGIARREASNLGSHRLKILDSFGGTVKIVPKFFDRVTKFTPTNPCLLPSNEVLLELSPEVWNNLVEVKTDELLS